MHMPGTSKGGLVFFVLVQIILLVLFAFFTDYDSKLLPNKGNATRDEPALVQKYPHFEDIHVMIFIGFGFLMTFLKKYGYSATGFNLWVAALVIQWAILMRGFFAMIHHGGHIGVSLDSMIGADIGSATVLISMGALLGRITPIQLLTMGLIEIVFFAGNEYLNVDLFRITDVGGSITIHAFGAYFGLACSLVLRPSSANAVTGENEGASYTSDIFAMVGSVFLWIYWPSFNSILVDGDQQERAILHTYLSLAACTVTTFCMSALLSKEKKFDMVHVQNSTLAGGVAVGSVCNLILHPWGAIMIGIISGVLSVVGYVYITPFLFSKLRLADTCGVNNLHGMPAVLSAIFSAIYAASATKETYGNQLIDIFPAMKQVGNNTEELEYVIGGYNRTSTQQGTYQLIGIVVTICIAVAGGVISGLILRSPLWNRLDHIDLHRDDVHWIIEEEEHEKKAHHNNTELHERKAHDNLNFIDS
ncbi:ammonium transporter Rh type A [Culicoides brevitarsis]|uniref:ammonium transporter Rh type A n=1 Tax=Culicoides brevitarsis TaxID=469753 RepID=UPI00307B77F6